MLSVPLPLFLLLLMCGPSMMRLKPARMRVLLHFANAIQ